MRNEHIRDRRRIRFQLPTMETQDREIGDLVESQWETIQAQSKTIEAMRKVLSKTQARLKALEAKNIPNHVGGSTTESPKTPSSGRLSID